MQLIDIIRQRSSYYAYDNTEVISDECIREIIALTTTAPTAYNLQNWQFIAVKSAEKKQALCQASYHQAKVNEAAVTFVVCGDLQGFKNHETALQPSLQAEQINQQFLEGWVQATQGTYENNSELQRDEAFRSASLATMLLMMVAEDKGYATGAMSGFVCEHVQAVLELPTHIVPVMLVTVGTPTTPRPEQKKRLAVESVLKIV